MTGTRKKSTSIQETRQRAWLNMAEEAKRLANNFNGPGWLSLSEASDAEVAEILSELKMAADAWTKAYEEAKRRRFKT